MHTYLEILCNDIRCNVVKFGNFFQKCYFKVVFMCHMINLKTNIHAPHSVFELIKLVAKKS